MTPTPNTWGAAVRDPRTKLGATARRVRTEREQAIGALMAKGMTREQAWSAWLAA